MGIIDKLNERFRARHQDAQRRYWTVLAKAARSGGDRASGALFTELEQAAESLGKSPEAIEGDIELLDQALALEDAPKSLERADAALAAAKKARVEALEEAAELEKRAWSMRSESDALFQKAAADRTLATRRVGELGEVRYRLADAGHPDYKHENKQARELRVNVESARTELRVIDGELAGFTEELISSNRSASKAYNTLKIRRAAIVEQLHRQGEKTSAEPVLAPGSGGGEPEPEPVLGSDRRTEDALGDTPLLGDEVPASFRIEEEQ